MFSIRGAQICIINKESGEKTGQFVVKTDRVTIGAHPLNNIRIPNLEAERLHCKLFADSSDSVTIHNFSVHNPVLLNGVRLEGKTVIHNGDKFEVAGCLFVWNYNSADIRAVPKSTKRATCLPSVRKPRSLKRVRSFGELVKQGSGKVPRDVGLMLNAIRKRRTIHSAIAPPLSNSQDEYVTQEKNNLTDNTLAQADISVKPALNDPNPSISTSNDTRIIEKENVTLRPEAPKLQTTGVMLTSYVSAVERRHLTCKTPVSSPRRTPLRHKNEKFDQTEMDEYLVNISNPHDSMHLIDLTTPVKSRRPSSVRKVFSGKVVQSPRVLDAINLITPSPKKVNRTPISSKAPAPATPKVALLKSAIKNSRIHASDTKKTPLASSLSSKKTPNVKINTLRTDTPKVTPTSSKSSLVKLRKHLISSLNKQDPADTKAPMMVSAALSQHSTPVHVPITSVITLKDDHVSPTHQQSKQADVPEYENFMIENVEKTAVENAAVVVPIFDVQSVIKKPNRTTQIRSAKYSDVTPHESFMDGVTPAAAVPSEENTLMLHADNSVSVPSNTLQEELNNLSDLPTSIHPHRNSCLPNTTMQFSPQPSNSRKTISAVNYNSLSISPMSRVSIAEDSIKETDVNDLDSETSSLDEIVNEDELLASSDSESVHEIEPMVGEVGVRTPQLGHSLRDTRKFIGSAFTSLNTSRPQLDLTAEIDESLLLNDEEEDCDNNEFYNMEKSHESILTNEQIISNNVTVCDQTAKQMEAVSDSCSKFTSNYLSNSMRECVSSKLSTTNGNRRYTLCSAAVDKSSTGLTKQDENSVSKHITNNTSEEESKRVSDFSIHEQLESAGAVLDSSKETLNTTEDCSSTSAIRCVPSTMQNQTSDACVEANNEMQSMYSTPKALHPTEALKRQSICINLVGVKELLKTPKIVDADIHAGQEIEEMFRTPKSGSLSATGKKRSVVKLVGSEELHKTSIQGNADTQEYLDVGLKGTVLLGGNIEDSFENNELLKSPKSIYSADADLKESTNVVKELPSANMEDNCAIEAMVKTPKPVSDADQNESICAVLVDSDEALSPTTDIKDNCEVVGMVKTPKSVSSDADHNESSCAELVNAEEAVSTKTDIEDNCEVEEMVKTSKLILSTDEDQNESICAELVNAEEAVSTKTGIEDNCEVEEMVKSSKPVSATDGVENEATYVDVVDIKAAVLPCADIDDTCEAEVIIETPKAISSKHSQREKPTCVNLVGVKELMKTPIKSDSDDQDYCELQDMFKTPKQLRSTKLAQHDQSFVNLVGVKELLKTPKNMDTEGPDSNAMKSMFQTPKPKSSTIEDQNESIGVELVDTEDPASSSADMEDNCADEAMVKTPKRVSSTDAEQNESTNVEQVDVEDTTPPSAKVEDNCDIEAMIKTPKPVSSTVGDQNDSTIVELVHVADPASPSANMEDNCDVKAIIKTPKPVPSRDADQNESSNVEQVDVEDPTSPSANVEDNCDVEAIVKTPKPVSSTDADQNESICAVLVESDEALSPTNDTKDNCEVVEMVKTPKPILSTDEDQNESICVELVDTEYSASPGADMEDNREVKDMVQKPKPVSSTDGVEESTCDDDDLEDAVVPASPCADIEDKCEAEVMIETPKAISSKPAQKNKPTCVNLVGVKELMKTPKKSDSDDQDYCELQDMFKTPKLLRSTKSAQHDQSFVNLVGVKELLKTPKNMDTEGPDSNAMKSMFQTPKPKSSTIEDQNESTSVELVNIEHNCKVKEVMKTPKSVSSDADHNESICAELVNAEKAVLTKTDIEDNCEVEEMVKSSKPVFSTDGVEKRSTCADVEDTVDPASSSAAMEHTCEVEVMIETPKAISSKTAQKEKSIDVNLVGVKELLKTPIKSDSDDQEYCELQDMFKTPKLLRSAKSAQDEQSFVNLVGVKELLKTPKNMDTGGPDSNAMKSMFQTPKPKSSTIEDQNESICVQLVDTEDLTSPSTDMEDNREVKDMVQKPKPVSSTDGVQESTCDDDDLEDAVVPASPCADIEDKCEAEVMIETPKAISSKPAQKNKPTCVNLVGVKELLKTPIKSDSDDQDYCELQDMFKTPKLLRSTKSAKDEQYCVNLVGVKELLKTPKNIDTEGPDSNAMKSMFQTPKPVSSGKTDNDKRDSDSVGVKELLQTPKNSTTETEGLSDSQDMVKTPQTVPSNKVDKEKPVTNDDVNLTKSDSRESIQNVKEVTNPDPTPPAKITRKRRLYSRKDEEIKTPDKLSSSSPQRVDKLAEYMDVLKFQAKHKNILTENVLSSPARRNMPKRSCRQKIESLSEEILAGKSPAPKYCKPLQKDLATPTTKEEVLEITTRRKVIFNEAIHVKEFDSPNIVGDVIRNVNRKAQGKKRTTQDVQIAQQANLEEERVENSLASTDAQELTDTKDSSNISETTKELPEKPTTKRGRTRKVKETLEDFEPQKAITKIGRQRRNVSKASSELEDSVSEKQNKNITDEDKDVVEYTEEVREENVNNKSSDLATPQKTSRRRQQAKGLKLEGSSLLTEQKVNDENVKEVDTPVVKRGRPAKKASETLTDKSNSTPMKRGRSKKVTEKEEETVSTDQTDDETKKSAKDETELVRKGRTAKVEVNSITESEKGEQDVIKSALKGRRHRIDSHNEGENGHETAARGVQEEAGTSIKGRERKIEEPEGKGLEKEAAETAQVPPKAVGRGRRRKIEVHGEDETVKEETKSVGRGRRRKIENHDDEASPIKGTDGTVVQDALNSVGKSPRREIEVQVEEESAKEKVAVAQDDAKPVGKGRRRKAEVNTEEYKEKEEGAVTQPDAKPVGKGRRRKVEVRTEEESDVEQVDVVKPVGKGRWRKKEVQEEEDPKKTEEKQESIQRSKRTKIETASVGDSHEPKSEHGSNAKTTKARKITKKGEENNPNDSGAVEDTVESSPKPETRPVRRTRAKRN